MHEYVLYYFESCPYCQKVLRFLDREGITVPMKEATDQKIAEELVRIGGKYQVPCLVIDGKAMYESDDIIKYWKTNRE